MTEYEKYLEKYCAKHKISKEEAETHALVKEVRKQYEQEKEESHENHFRRS